MKVRLFYWKCMEDDNGVLESSSWAHSQESSEELPPGLSAECLTSPCAWQQCCLWSPTSKGYRDFSWAGSDLFLKHLLLLLPAPLKREMLFFLFSDGPWERQTCNSWDFIFFQGKHVYFLNNFSCGKFWDPWSSCPVPPISQGH